MRRHRRLALLLVIPAALLAPGGSASAAPPFPFLPGLFCTFTALLPPRHIDLPAFVDAYVQNIPPAGQGKYVDPDSQPGARDAVVKAFNQARQGFVADGCTTLRAGNTNFRIFRAIDGDGTRLVIMQDRQGSTANRGWGLYIIRVQSTSPVVVEVPHACPDTHPKGPQCDGGDPFTQYVAVDAFRAASAHYLFVAGADRRANGKYDTEHPGEMITGTNGFCGNGPSSKAECSDAAHQPRGMFERIHEAAVDAMASGTPRVYQSHGFSSANHQDPEPIDNRNTSSAGGNGVDVTANVVVSSGEKTPSALATSVADAVEEGDPNVVHACLYLGAGTCSALGATHNVQKAHMHGGLFVHVEASEKVVTDRTDCTTANSPCLRLGEDIGVAVAKG